MTTQLGKHRRIRGTERDELARQLVARYEKGASIRALAESTGRSYDFMHRLLSESSVTLRGRGGDRPGRRHRRAQVVA